MSLPFLEPIVERIAALVWQRPELTPLREPIEAALGGNAFKALTEKALRDFQQQGVVQLPYLDEGYLRMEAVQLALATYITAGTGMDELVRLYAKRLPVASSPSPEMQTQLQAYLQQLRQTLVSHPAYGDLILAREQEAMLAALGVFRREVHDRLDALGAEQRSAAELLLNRLDQIFKEPELQALVERKQGTHIFLSYSRHNAELARSIRQGLEAAGHRVWQDTTAIKGGAEWIDSIADGIRRAYALVTLVSTESQQSRWVRLEFLEADRRGKPIVPINTDGCEIPIEMLDRNVIHGYPDLMKGIQLLLATLPTPTAGETLQADLEKPDLRHLELDYLDKILLEHAVWQEVYTPMAGVGQLRKAQPKTDKPVMVTTATDIASRFKRRLVDSNLHTSEVSAIEQQDFDNILTAIEQLRQLVVLGDPGAGKTTTLWKIAADAAQKAKADPSAPLPVLIRLGALHDSLRDQLAAQLAPLNLDTLLAQQQLVLLLDGLNEIPAANRDATVQDIRALVKSCQAQDLLIAVTCRELDYQEALDLGIPEKVMITPLDPPRIYRFVQRYLTAPPEAADTLFWELAGQQARQQWEAFSKAVNEPMEVFWLAETLPEGKSWGWDGTNRRWERWLKVRQQPRSMLHLATNPFMLYMITQVFTEAGQLPPNRGSLFNLFVDFLLLDRQRFTAVEAERLKRRLAKLAYAMQRVGEGTTFSRAVALDTLAGLGDRDGEKQLYQAQAASLLTGDTEIRFTHQLLQEYFAARRLDHERQRGKAATEIWQPERWWKSTGWEETAILLAGLYDDDTTPIIEWLKDAQPELTVRCILESGAFTSQATIDRLRPAWLPRLTDLNADPAPKARAAIGRALGRLQLDNRKGVGLRADGLPDLDWVEIPGGPFQFGGDPDAFRSAEAQTLDLPTFFIARYPITYAQFQAFIDDPEGHSDGRWWDDLAAERYRRQNQRQPETQSFKYSNHPRENVSWYDAIAFCRWLSCKLGGVWALDKVRDWKVRLPTTAEWEKAARGTEGQIYPYGNEFDQTKSNTLETFIGQTSTVGIFPNGASPYGVLDMSGNVWEWCLTEYISDATSNLNNSKARALQGGSWHFNRRFARLTSRYGDPPGHRSSHFGFRVVCASPGNDNNPVDETELLSRDRTS